MRAQSYFPAVIKSTVEYLPNYCQQTKNPFLSKPFQVLQISLIFLSLSGVCGEHLGWNAIFMIKSASLQPKALALTLDSLRERNLFVVEGEFLENQRLCSLGGVWYRKIISEQQIQDRWVDKG